MVRAFAQLILIAVGFLVVAAVAVVTVRWMGAQQTFLEPPHPWLSRAFWAIYKPTPQDTCIPENLHAKAHGTEPGLWIYAIHVRHHEEEWNVACPQGPLTVEQFLKRSTHIDWLLLVDARDTWSLDQLVREVAAYDGSKRFAISTDSQKVALYLRKKAPQWLFAADSASLVRLRLFESLWIETAIDFWPDFVVATFDPKAALKLDERSAEELARRKKRLIWDWTGPGEPNLPIQGVMSETPAAVTQKFGARL